MSATVTVTRADYRWPPAGFHTADPGMVCPPDGCDYREVTPHGLMSAAFVECRRCGHTGWVIVTP
jgi:hypothetical protein